VICRRIRRLCELILCECSAPNPRVQPDAASAEQIVAILRVGFVSNVISIDQGDATHAQAVRTMRRSHQAQHIAPDWAPKVSPPQIRRLYETDACGVYDEELLIEVGSALYSRCLSILAATDRRTFCPLCHQEFQTDWRWNKRYEQLRIVCPSCGKWEIRGSDFRKSIERDTLAAPGARAWFEAFVNEWPRSHTPAQKMISIDQLLHGFHWSPQQQDIPHRATANNLIEGTHDSVIELLNTLTYGTANSPGVQETFERWQQQAEEMQQLRHTPRDERGTLFNGSVD
jgi:hypothetical protein